MMTVHPGVFDILMAEDDSDDQMLARDALDETGRRYKLNIVETGSQLIQYLRGREGPPPELILLDLNMPEMTGEEALRIIKRDPKLRSIPVVVLTTSNAREDIRTLYDLGVNSFITKPSSYSGLVEMMTVLLDYWGDKVRLPNRMD